MKFAYFLPLLTALLLPFTVNAHNFSADQRVPVIAINDKGELLYQQDKFSYQNWNSTHLTGKVRVIQHIAGRSSAKEKNATLIEAIKTAHFPADVYQTTTIVNTDDAIPGTGMFVLSSIRSNKKQYPWSQFIVDRHGLAKKAWHLESGSSAIVVLDKQGKVCFAKDGALTQEEVSKVITLVKSLLPVR